MDGIMRGCLRRGLVWMALGRGGLAVVWERAQSGFGWAFDGDPRVWRPGRGTPKSKEAPDVRIT